MNRSQKVASVVSVLVVAGLVAVAAPAVAPIAAEAAGWGLFTSTATTPAPSADAATDVEKASSESSAGEGEPKFPEDYVEIGSGTFIPKGGPGECTASAYIWIGSLAGEPMHVEMQGADLVDMGPNEFANGDVDVDDQGRPTTYTVAPGDVISRIGDRFCIYNGGMLDLLNGYSHGAVIQPGDVLTLDADLITDWVDPYAEG